MKWMLMLQFFFIFLNEERLCDHFGNKNSNSRKSLTFLLNENFLSCNGYTSQSFGNVLRAGNLGTVLSKKALDQYETWH